MRHLRLAFSSLAIAAVAACSGGGSSSPSAPVPIYTGEGATQAINQKITFTIIVPAAQSGVASARRPPAPSTDRRLIASASPTPAPPYFSPATGAIVLSLAEINGVSPQVVPPAIPPIDVACQACTFTVPNIPAALGTNRYFVQTYTSYANGAAAGNLISSGFVDVTVPVTANPKLGGIPTLSVGGYVAQIDLAPGTVNFNSGVAGDHDIFVTALDSGGATIVGAVQYANPIVVTVTDAQNTSLNGAQSIALAGTEQKAIDLHYGGGVSFGSQVQASTTNENGVSVSASPIAVNIVQPSPTPTPTLAPGQTPPPSPTPTPPPRFSLYVADANSDTVSEYAVVSQIAAGQIPNPITPKRVLQFNEPGVAQLNSLLACAPSPFVNFGSVPNGSSNGTIGVAIAANGTIFTLPTCWDGSNQYVFGFPANSVGVTTPTIIDPAATSTLFGTIGNPEALQYAASQSGSSTIFALFDGNTAGLAGWSSTTNNQQPVIAVGQECYQEFTYPTCTSSSDDFNGNESGAGFGVDNFGYAYIPAYWNDMAIGDVSGISEPGGVLAVSASGNTSLTTTPQSMLTGTTALLAAGGTPPSAAYVDGQTLYVLTGYNTVDFNDVNGDQLYPGLSACPAPTAGATVNPSAGTIGNQPNTNCEGGVSTYQHFYLVAYAIGGLLGNTVNQTDVDLTPKFALGGDTVGGFGCAGLGAGGEMLAASAGYVYVLNEYPSCATETYAPEIDIYNTNNVSGYHTDIAPVARISLASSYPSAIAVGPSGSVVGGLDVLRKPHHGYRTSFYRGPRHPPLSRRRPPYR
jgi:hypothetical protein